MSIFYKVLELLHKHKVEPNEDGNIGIGWDAAAEGFTGVRMGYPKQSWISVNEKLPETYIDVLIYDECGIEIGYFRKTKEWHTYYGDDVITVEVTHWMPLPCPPKES